MDWDYKTNGHYFFDDFERGDSTCDIEFQKGRVTDESHRKDSMYLWDDHFYFLDLEPLFSEVIPEFDMFTCGCEINTEQWEKIQEASANYCVTTREIITEMDAWMTETLKEYGCVTVLGV